jgi:hypothetical protein
LIIPSKSTLFIIWFFLAGKLLAIPGLFLAVYQLSCVEKNLDVTDTKNITGADLAKIKMMNFYNSNAECLFSEDSQFWRVILIILLLLFPLLGYFYRKLEFLRSIKKILVSR